MPLVIADVHPSSDKRQIIRGLTWVRALLPTSCVQGADIMMIIARNEEANLLEGTSSEQCAQKSVKTMLECLFTVYYRNV